MILNKEIPYEDARRALAEDLGTGDVTAELLPSSLVVQAEIISREAMLLCGLAWVEAVFFMVDPGLCLKWQAKEGQFLSEPSCLCLLEGKAKSILTAERTALNFLQTLSGTATETYRYVLALENKKTQLLDTRKTIPGLRYAQKYAVFCAGASNHRMGLYDAYLIKENHIAACGSISEAVKRARLLNKDLMLEVEVENITEFTEALEAQVDRILLDNFSLEALKEAVALNKPKRAELEVSGGINLSNILQIADVGIDYISVGALTKSLRAIDLSLLIRKA